MQLHRLRVKKFGFGFARDLSLTTELTYGETESTHLTDDAIIIAARALVFTDLLYAFYFYCISLNAEREAITK